MLARKNHKLK